jgi:hypothetical protein
VGVCWKVVPALVAVVAALALAAPSQAAVSQPVPSLTPLATQKLWTQLVQRRRAFGPLATKDCKPLRAVFYTEADWLRLATKLAQEGSPCGQYYISIPPLAADHTTFRSNQAWRIRALGSNFHALAEVNYTGWSRWVASGQGSFYDAGVEARRRMATAGFDVNAGDTWALNELSSAVRKNTGVSRQNARDLLRGLYTGDGSTPTTKGVVWAIGISQTKSDLATYKVNLQDWYSDTGFWQDMSSYVSDWSQELYGDVPAYAVAGATLDQRRDHLDDFLTHQLALAAVAPSTADAARAFLASASTPLANAAWIWSGAFGNTNVPLAAMQDYVSAQVYTLRTFDGALGYPQDRFGFAWAPRNGSDPQWTTTFTAQSGALLDRLAQAIRDSAETPAGACNPTWCTATVPNAAFTEGWKTFATWSPPQLAFAGAPTGLAPNTASGPFTLTLQTNGIADPQSTDLPATLASSSPTGTFSTSATGPWSATLALTIPAGQTTSAPVYYLDPTAGTAVLTATDGSGSRSSASAAVAVVQPTVRVPKIGTGVRNRRLFVYVRAVDAANAPVAGATLRLDVRLGAKRFTTLTGRTGATGRATLTSAKKVTRGCYRVMVRAVSASGLAWDGRTPANRLCRLHN